MLRLLVIDNLAGILGVSATDHAAHMSNGTVALLLISFANLCFIAIAVFYPYDERATPSGESIIKASAYNTLALVLASCSQVLYVTFGAAWWFQWMRFYPGNSLQTVSILGGLVLSASAFVAAIFGMGLKRWAGVFVAVTTGGLWLLSALASVAI
jgi:hypothetical protein